MVVVFGVQRKVEGWGCRLGMVVRELVMVMVVLLLLRMNFLCTGFLKVHCFEVEGWGCWLGMVVWTLVIVMVTMLLLLVDVVYWIPENFAFTYV